MAMAVAFPWPTEATAEGLIARGKADSRDWPLGLSALDPIVHRLAEQTGRALHRRWPKADVTVVDDEPASAILARARKAGVVVVGSQGHGTLVPTAIGSVCRAVVRGSKCPVLVVKRPSRVMRSLVIGLDGSTNAERAVAFVARLVPPEGGSVTLLRVVEPVLMPLFDVLAGVSITGEAAALEAERVQAARRDVAKAAGVLKRAGWDVREEVSVGVPADELTTVAKNVDGVIVGAGRGRWCAASRPRQRR